MKSAFIRYTSIFLSLTMVVGGSAFAASQMSAPAISAALESVKADDVEDGVKETANQTADAGDLPSKIDLRERGVVPAIRDQSPWGTCWGFGSIAASEISILSDLGLTCEQFKEENGYDMDLSERHLAWYATYHMPESLEQNSELAEVELAQAGEGIHNIAEDSDPGAAHFDCGGIMMLASSVFSAGFGPVYESVVPYTANDGTLSSKSDWSVSEDTRFLTDFDLLDSNVMPSPAQKNSDGTGYTYNEAATDAIKREIVKGHAVAIAYHGDISQPSELNKNKKSDLKAKPSTSGNTADSDDSWDSIEESIVDLGYNEDEAEIALSVLENGSYEDLSDDDRALSAEIFIMLLADDDTYETLLDELDSGDITAESILDEVLKALDSEDDSNESDDDADDSDDDSYDEDSEEDEKQYINLSTYAQYTYDDNAEVDHVVCIIGYDDDYAVSNFLEGHQPSKPGAWLCRNSWGSDWGLEGYFYLSYYDKTISIPESFTFDVTDFDNRTDELTVLNYDFMPVQSPNAITPNGTASAACVYTIDDESVLTNASIFTAVQNTDATISVYLLNENAKTPEDGEKLETLTQNFPYAGYHRVKFEENYVIPANGTISIVVSQTRNGKAILPVNVSTNYEYAVATAEDGELTSETSWCVAKVNAGESFVCDNGTWVDWKTVIDEVTADDSDFAYLAIDNPSLKLYLYPLDQMQEIHNLDETTTDAEGNKISVCDEDNYTIIYTNEQ